MTEDRSFSSLEIQGWRQFKRVKLDLSRRLTILSGVNGAGKTSILNLLGRHFNWQSSFLSVPRRHKSGNVKYLTGVRGYEPDDESSQNPWREVGRLAYSDGAETAIAIHAEAGVSYEVQLGAQQQVNGLYISSHRNTNSYQQVQTIPASFVAGNQVLDQYINEIRQRYLGAYSGKNATLVMKEALLAAALYGEGSSHVTPNPEAAAVWNGFQNVLRILMPPAVGFESLQIQPPDIIFKTRTGEFLIDAVSGGMNAVLELGWQIFLRSRQYKKFTICFDEPENHLHPSLQRTLIPSMLKAFPDVSFIVATHSPFMVTSEPDANVYVLNHDGDGVVSESLDFANKAASAEETLRDVLGLPTTLPTWAEDRFNWIISRYAAEAPTRETLMNLREELIRAGLESSLPKAVSRITDKAIAADGEPTEQ